MSSCPPPRWCTGAESRSEEAAEKEGGKKVGKENDRKPPPPRPVSAVALSPEQRRTSSKNTGTLNEFTRRKKREEICVCAIRNPPRSSRQRFVELSCVSTLTENPNQIVRGEGTETQVDFASSIISSQERMCPVFSCLLGFAVSLSYTFSSIQSPFFQSFIFIQRCSGRRGRKDLYTSVQLLLYGDPAFTGSQNNKLVSGYS